MTAIGTDAIAQVTNPLDSPTLAIAFIATAGQTVGVDKVVTLFTFQDAEQPVRAAQAKLASLPSYAILLAAHQQSWHQVWQDSDVEIEGDIQAQLVVRYNLFQLSHASATVAAGGSHHPNGTSPRIPRPD